MLLIKNTIRPVKHTKANEHACWMYNNRGSFWDLYKNPSAKKKKIYECICAEAARYNYSSLHCAGGPFTFSVYYVYKENGKYYLKCVTPGKVKNIEVEVEELR
jgi:hypothetical protein